MNYDKARLEGLLAGPWTTQAIKAEKFLRPPARLVSRLLPKERISEDDLIQAERNGVDVDRSKTIKRVLRAHWETEEGITDEKEIALRDAFDEALTFLQLLELSAESGYLPEKFVVSVARERVLALLWPKGARSFVENYDYLAVRFLAARCKVDLGLNPVTPPEPDPRAEVQFGTFLSQLQGWYHDNSLDWWLGLLDDYVVEDDDDLNEPEADAFYRFLRTGKLTSSSRVVEVRFLERAEGLKRFVFLLSNLFSFLPAEVVPLYGTFFLYWMAKFHGYELGKNGYYRDSDMYYEWSCVAKGPVVCPPAQPDDDPQTHADRKALVEEQLQIIKDGFKLTRDFVNSHM